MRAMLFAAIAWAACLIASGTASAQHHGHQSHKGHDAAQSDTRVPVALPPDLAGHMLANMRDHLLALQEINDALARGSYDKAAKIAEERLGMPSLKMHGAHEVSKFMPQGMQDAGTAMHRAASRFAIEAQNAGVSGDIKPALSVLGEVMGACVSCHGGYRIK